ncbi:MAG: SDR family NAD(P)-dependent oxidoreductase [Anaerolineaceae bacterium]|jgi:3-oxoacyl-[acyl-carrier protein] reductase
MDTSKKVVIVTGASRGLGEAIARQVAKMGGSLVLNARSADKLEAVAEELRKMGADVVAVPGDVTDPSTADKIIAQALGHYGKIDSLVNNSGIIEPIAPLSKADPEAWRANLEVNLLSVVMLTQRAIPHLRETNGTIISISSGAATRVIPGWGHTAWQKLVSITSQLSSQSKNQRSQVSLSARGSWIPVCRKKSGNLVVRACLNPSMISLFNSMSRENY